MFPANFPTLFIAVLNQRALGLKYIISFKYGYSLDTNWTKPKEHIAVKSKDLAFSIRGAREGFLYQGQRGHVVAQEAGQFEHPSIYVQCTSFQIDMQYVNFMGTIMSYFALDYLLVHSTSQFDSSTQYHILSSYIRKEHLNRRD